MIVIPLHGEELQQRYRRQLYLCVKDSFCEKIMLF